jgi:hypothetical protein
MDQHEISKMLMDCGFATDKAKQPLLHGAQVALLTENMWSRSNNTKTWNPDHPFAPAMAALIADQMSKWLDELAYQQKELISEPELLPVLSRLYGNMLRLYFDVDSDDNFFFFRIKSVEDHQAWLLSNV